MRFRSFMGIATTLALVGALAGLLLVRPAEDTSPGTSAPAVASATAAGGGTAAAAFDIGSMVAEVAPVADAAASEPLGVGPLHTDGGNIVDGEGRVVHISGVNWFGLETGTFAPQGLWARGLDSMLDQIAQTGFNTIRLPYSDQLF